MKKETTKKEATKKEVDEEVKAPQVNKMVLKPSIKVIVDGVGISVTNSKIGQVSKRDGNYEIHKNIFNLKFSNEQLNGKLRLSSEEKEEMSKAHFKNMVAEINTALHSLGFEGDSTITVEDLKEIV